jgi:GNAT superfamily N-acetyltransferase
MNMKTQNQILYQRDLNDINWLAAKEAYRLSDWDTDRTAEQLQRCFQGSYTTCLALCRNQVVGTARAISDGLDSAMIADVWVHPEMRGQGIGRAMKDGMKILCRPNLRFRQAHRFLCPCDG